MTWVESLEKIVTDYKKPIVAAITAAIALNETYHVMPPAALYAAGIALAFFSVSTSTMKGNS